MIVTGKQTETKHTGDVAPEVINIVTNIDRGAEIKLEDVIVEAEIIEEKVDSIKEDSKGDKDVN